MFIPYGRQWIDDDDIAAVKKVLTSDFLTQGPEVVEFEQKICSFTEAKHCIAVSNGTAALHLAVAALQIEAGYEGITSPITFAASANCMCYNSLQPKFCDIDAKTYTMDPSKLENSVTDKTKLIVPVHFAGQPADMRAIQKIADAQHINIIEDAAHAIGSVYQDGSPVGNCKYSDMTIFSFHPVKTITTGEGGAITTNNEELYSRLLQLRSHGITKDPGKMLRNEGPWYYEMQELGYNYRLSDIHAALGSSQLDKLTDFKKRRRQIVEHYNSAFNDVEWITTPFEAKGVDSCFHLYTILIDFTRLQKSRTEVMDELRRKNIGTQVHYIPVHLQPFYKTHFSTAAGQFQVAEEYYKKTLSLPLYPKMSEADVLHVIEAVKGLEKC